MTTNHPPDGIISTLKKANRLLLVTHIHPDGDALGSQLALGDVLRSLGKEVCLFGEEPVSHLYDFLPGSSALTTMLPETDNFDCAVALDCGDRFRLGNEMDTILRVSPFVVIDHHAGHKEFGDLRWIDDKRASTGEMVYDLAVSLNAAISYEAAYCLYSAIVSDTGSFKYSSTTADTFRIAGELLGKGVKPAEVAGRLFDNFSVNRLHLMRRVLDSFELYADDQIAVISVSADVFDETGTSQVDTETFINYPRSLHTVKVAAFIKEIKNGLIGVSLRSKGNDCDVARIATMFGGGGHRNAAGFKVQAKTIEEVREKLLEQLVPLVND